jgi:hypothetical protein
MFGGDHRHSDSICSLACSQPVPEDAEIRNPKNSVSRWTLVASSSQKKLHTGSLLNARPKIPEA